MRAEPQARIGANYHVLSLLRAAQTDGWQGPYVESARRFVCSLTDGGSGEDGERLWGWILDSLADVLVSENAALRQGRPTRGVSLFETLFLADRTDGETVGTISVVRDDRGWGKKYGLSGVWLGGFHVRPDRQGWGLGSCLFYNAVNHVRVLAAGRGGDRLRVNLFTRNELVRRMAAAHGFTQNGGITLVGEEAGSTHHWLQL